MGQLAYLVTDNADSIEAQKKSSQWLKLVDHVGYLVQLIVSKIEHSQTPQVSQTVRQTSKWIFAKR